MKANNTLASKPHDKKEKLQYMSDSFFADFLQDEYKPLPGIDWATLVPKNPGLWLGNNKGMTCESFLKRLPSILPDATIENLNNLSPEDASLFTELLLFLDSPYIEKGTSKLSEIYGDYILIYLYLHGYQHGGRREQFEKYIEHNCAFITDPLMFSALKCAKNQRTYKPFTERLLLFMRLATLEQKLQESDLLEKTLYPSLSSETRKDFSFHRISTKGPVDSGQALHRYNRPVAIQSGESVEHVVNCYLDGYYSIGLFYNAEPVAVIASKFNENNVCVIYQMQKISSDYYNRHGICIAKKVHPILEKLPNRQEILYNAMETILKQEQVEEVVIQGALNNKWCKTMQEYRERNDKEKRIEMKESQIPHLDKNIAKQIYTVFAQNHGFEYFHYDDKNRHKQL